MGNPKVFGDSIDGIVKDVSSGAQIGYVKGRTVYRTVSTEPPTIIGFTRDDGYAYAPRPGNIPERIGKVEYYDKEQQ